MFQISAINYMDTLLKLKAKTFEFVIYLHNAQHIFIILIYINSL